MTNEERRQAAWTVFEYERMMYLDLHAMSGKGLSPLHPAVNNAICEARVLHANILCEMLTGFVTGTGDYLSIADMIDGSPFPQELYALAKAHGSWLAEGTLAHACHFRVKTPGSCRGSSFDYTEILAKIHEPLVAAMEAVLARRNQERLDKAKESFEEAVEEAAEEVKPCHICGQTKEPVPAGPYHCPACGRTGTPDPASGWPAKEARRKLLEQFVRDSKFGGGKIVSIPKPRFVKLTSLKGDPEFVDIAKVMAVGMFDSPGQLNHTRVSFSPDGHYWLVVTESPEEVVAKLEGRA